MRNLSLAFLLAMVVGFYGCGGSDAPPADTTDVPAASDSTLSETPAPVTPAAIAEATPTAAGSTLDLIPDNAVAAILVRPSKAMGNQLVKDVTAMATEMNPDMNIEGQFAEMEKNAGITPDKIDHVLLILDQEFVDKAPMIAQMGPAAAAPIMVMELTSGTKAQTVLDAMQKSRDGASFQTLTGGAFEGVSTPDGGNLVKVGDSRLMFVKEQSRVQPLLDNKSKGKVATLLDKSAGADLTIVLDLAPVKQQLQQVMQQNPNPAMALVMPLVTQMQMISIAADLEGGNLLQINVETPNGDAASGVREMLDGYLQMGKAQYAQAEAGVPEPIQPLTKQLVDNSALSADGNVVTLNVPRPEGFEKLPELLKPAMMEARQAAGNAVVQNNLRQIALAFHNYHDAYNHFPGLDSNGESDEANVKGKGLSWRVHLLPFLDEAALYDQFKLDEPWDSEHNKSLIPFMPAVFGDDPVGNTSIHVFAGEGLMFAEGKPGPKLRDITDGTSNTILFVKAGDDQATAWTKPSGLEFNADDPASALGEIGAMFEAAFADGFVTPIAATVDKQTLSNLIQQNDGNPVARP